MARRWITAFAGLAIGVALVATPAGAQPPVTKMTFRLDAREVASGSPITGSVVVSTRDDTGAVPLAGVQLSVQVDGTQVGTVWTGVDGSAGITYVSTEVGRHVMTVAYAGDAAHRPADRSDRFVVLPPPPTVPDPPFIDSADGGQGSVTLRWTTPPDGGSPITGYNVYRTDLQSGAEALLISLGVRNDYVDETVSSGTPYWYYVTAVNAVGESDPSNEFMVTPS